MTLTDEKLNDSFIKNDGYIILLSLIKEINEYANQVNAVAKVIDILEEWKKEEFYTNNTTYEIDWYLCYKHDKSISKVTLNQAKKIYRDLKLKYDTLYNMFVEASRIHYEGYTNKLTDKYFSFNKWYNLNVYDVEKIDRIIYK